MASKPPDPSSRQGRASFWFANHLFNPLIRLVLKSPLRPLLSSWLLVLSYRGRKSGKRYDLPVQFTQSAETLWIIPMMAEQKIWWRNLRGGAQVEVFLRGHRRQGWATLLSGSEDAAAVSQGLVICLRRFPALARMNGIPQTPDGGFDPGELSRVAKNLLMVRVQMQGAGGV